MMRIGAPKISRQQWNTFLYDPEIVTLESLVVLLTLSNVFVLYRILLDVCPFPIFVTWVQLFVGFLLSWLFGLVTREFPQHAYFHPFSIDCSLYRQVGLPIVIYIGMVTSANLLLARIPAVSAFPMAVSPAIYCHAVCRFLGCGQIYTPVRWLSFGIMFLGSIIGLLDPQTIGLHLMPAVFAYSLCSVIFRACCLETVMHHVEGQGHTLHAHTLVLGLLLLPPLSFMAGEWAVFNWLPSNWLEPFTYQSWCTLIVAGTIPFVKHIVANRLIRRTGQAPWRILETITMLAVLIIGHAIWRNATVTGIVSFILVLFGRLVGTLDVLSKDPIVIQRALQEEGLMGQEKPEKREQYDPTGLAASFDRTMEGAPSSDSPN